MKHIFTCCLLLIVVNAMHAQAQYAFRVSFRDKNGTGAVISNPAQYLSQRAIDRRSKWNLPVDSMDLPVAAVYEDSILHLTDGIFHSHSKWMNDVVVLMEDSSVISQVMALSFVKQVRLVAVYPTAPHGAAAVTPVYNGHPSLPALPDSSMLDSVFYGKAWTQTRICNGQWLHKNGWMGQDLLVAVMDCGFPNLHTGPAFDTLVQNDRIVDTFNFLSASLNVANNALHGSQCLSDLAGYVPGVFVGSAPMARYALYVTDDLATEQRIEEDNWMAALERADSIGADLVSASVGYNTFDNPDDDFSLQDLDGHTTGFAQAANIAVAKGMMVVTSAGNEGTSDWGHVLTPGDADSSMTVGSVNATGAIAATSGRGFTHNQVLKPNICGMGQGSYSHATTVPSVTNGTSVATPVMAGFTACLMQSLPDMAPVPAVKRIEKSANHFSAPDTIYGYGIPDFYLAYNNTGTGADNISGADSLYWNVYPTLFSEQVTMVLSHLSVREPYVISVCNTAGKSFYICRVVAPAGTYMQKIDSSDWPSGMYFITLKSGRGTPLVKKMVKVR